MFNITTSNLGKEKVNTVNARDLHKFLESKQDFSDWIKNLIRDFGFVQAVDFIDHKIMVGDKIAKIEYYISLDMAKEISMVQRSTKGKEARQYFIECHCCKCHCLLSGRVEFCDCAGCFSSDYFRHERLFGQPGGGGEYAGTFPGGRYSGRGVEGLVAGDQCRAG